MIKVADYIQTAFSMEDAAALTPIIDAELKENSKIILDFSNIKFFTTLFFNNAITKYVLSLGPDEYKKRFNLINLSEVGKTTYEHSLTNANSYYELSDKKKKKAEWIISETLENNMN